MGNDDDDGENIYRVVGFDLKTAYSRTLYTLHLFYEQHALAIYRRRDVEECDLHNTLASIPNLLLALR